MFIGPDRHGDPRGANADSKALDANTGTLPLDATDCRTITEHACGTAPVIVDQQPDHGTILSMSEEDRMKANTLDCARYNLFLRQRHEEAKRGSGYFSLGTLGRTLYLPRAMHELDEHELDEPDGCTCKIDASPLQCHKLIEFAYNVYHSASVRSSNSRHLRTHRTHFSHVAVR